MAASLEGARLQTVKTPADTGAQTAVRPRSEAPHGREKELLVRGHGGVSRRLGERNGLTQKRRHSAVPTKYSLK